MKKDTTKTETKPREDRKTRKQRSGERRQEKRRQKAEELSRRREEVRAQDGNLFNHISRGTHNVVQNVFSNLRFSLGLRISANYARLLLSMLFRNVPVFLLIFLLWQVPILIRAADYTAGQLAAAPNPETELTELWDGDRYTFQISDQQTVREWEADMPDWLLELRQWVSPVSGVALQGHHAILITRHDVLRDGVRQTIFLRRDIWAETHLFLQLLTLLLAFDALRAVWFLIEGRRINRKVLKPVADITQHAQMLSEHDLSLRLNIEGTKNELKDLAVVINEMLDRIEAAYNGQKQFVSDASHELRTPIAVIQGYAGLLERWGKDSPQVRDEAIAAILAETENMKELVEKLLFLARHDKRNLQLKMEHFDIRQLMEEVIRETEMITSGHVVEKGKLSMGLIYGDRAAIKQAIRIFIDNAVKYTPTGGTIRISCLHEGGQVVISIQDTGIGMTKKEMNNIFQRFYRADEARAGKTSGHGLGLSIAKIIVLSHGGKIHVHSQKGVGSTFEMVIPI